MTIPRILLEEYISSSKCDNACQFVCQFKDVVELVLPNTRSGRTVLSNWKVSLDLLSVAYCHVSKYGNLCTD